MEMTSKDRRALMILGSVALVGLLLFVFVLHKSGGSAPQPNPAAVSGSQESPSPAPSPSPSPRATKTKARAHHHAGGAVQTPRDPFEVLVQASDASGSSTGSSTSPSPSPSPSASPSPSPSPSSSPTGGAFGTSTHVAGHTVTLLGFQTASDGAKQAVTRIDSTYFIVEAGQSLSNQFKLVAINDPCADFSHGSETFTVCLG